MKLWRLIFEDGTKAYLENRSAEGAKETARLLIFRVTGRLLDLDTIQAEETHFGTLEECHA